MVGSAKQWWRVENRAGCEVAMLWEAWQDLVYMMRKGTWAAGRRVPSGTKPGPWTLVWRLSQGLGERPWWLRWQGWQWEKRSRGLEVFTGVCDYFYKRVNAGLFHRVEAATGGFVVGAVLWGFCSIICGKPGPRGAVAWRVSCVVLRRSWQPRANVCRSTHLRCSHRVWRAGEAFLACFWAQIVHEMLRSVTVQQSQLPIFWSDRISRSSNSGTSS